MKISRFFYDYEVTDSAVAKAHGIDNTPGAAAIENSRRLAIYILDPIRDSIAAPIFVNSWYRSAALNAHKDVGGAPDSFHLSGAAADIWTPSMSALKLARHIAAMPLAWEELVLEYGRWVHIAVPRTVTEIPQREVITYYKDAEGAKRRVAGIDGSVFV